MTHIDPLQTVFNGVRYRSRTEARWAVYFHLMKEEFVYEPEGYRLSNGECYLPDFWLPNIGLFVEIKPLLDDYRSPVIPGFSDNPEKAGYPREMVLCDLLARETGRAVMLIYGVPTNHKALFYGQTMNGKFVTHSDAADEWRSRALVGRQPVLYFVHPDSWAAEQYFDYEFRPLDRVTNCGMMNDLGMLIDDDVDVQRKTAAVSIRF